MTSLSHAAARRKQWNVLIPAGMGMALALAGDLTLYAVLPVYAAGLGISLASLGVLLSANRLIRLGSNPLVGLLADRFSRRKMVLLGLTTGVISTLLYVVARGVWVLLLGRLLWGISWSILYIGIYCMILDVTDQQDRGWGSGMLQTFYFVGLAITPVMGGFLTNQLGFSNGLLGCAILQAIGLLGALFFLPDTGTETRSLAQQQPQHFSLRKTLSAALNGLRGFSFSVIARNREIVSANYLYLLTLFIGDGIIMSTITLYLMQRYNQSVALGLFGTVPVATVGGLLISLRAVVSAGAAPLAGHWSDSAGTRWAVAGWGVLAAVAGCASLAVDGGFWMILIGIVFASLGSGMLMAVLPAIVACAGSNETGQQSGLTMGILTTSGDIGCAIAPLVSYALLGVISLAQLYVISAVLLITGGALIYVLTHRKSVRVSPEMK